MQRELDLPPPYTAVALREHGDAFRHAQAIAAEAGAGTLVWVRRFDRAEMAVVLEPEEPLVAARCAHYAVMNAAGDALAAHCPPEKPLEFAWPDTILLDGGIIGGARLAWPEAAAEDVPPQWLVAAVTLRLVLPLTRRTRDAASHPLDITAARGTSLEIEGFEAMDAATLIGGMARHLMVQVDRWRESGLPPVAEQLLARLPRAKCVDRRLDANGDLLLRRRPGAAEGAVERLALVDALRTPQWLDPETGDPWA